MERIKHDKLVEKAVNGWFHQFDNVLDLAICNESQDIIIL